MYCHFSNYTGGHVKNCENRFSLNQFNVHVVISNMRKEATSNDGIQRIIFTFSPYFKNYKEILIWILPSKLDRIFLSSNQSYETKYMLYILIICHYNKDIDTGTLKICFVLYMTFELNVKISEIVARAAIKKKSITDISLYMKWVYFKTNILRTSFEFFENVLINHNDTCKMITLGLFRSYNYPPSKCNNYLLYTLVTLYKYLDLAKQLLSIFIKNKLNKNEFFKCL
ncbi:hypothetical protein AGLY_014486 [Aphis glycines]|uniref:Uncharacterized protein n=1 Tax=Aphis glycines TaxID=307491 RepID=A0A6G0T3I4_APHGL|nr:hypothetical protein AGLY_014486 [Aphis glycines]